jgi:hypothetical protein
MESRSSPALPPSPALAWASPEWSTPPRHSWTPAAPPTVPGLPAARLVAAENWGDILTVTTTGVEGEGSR